MKDLEHRSHFGSSCSDFCERSTLRTMSGPVLFKMGSFDLSATSTEDLKIFDTVLRIAKAVSGNASLLHSGSSEMRQKYLSSAPVPATVEMGFWLVDIESTANFFDEHSSRFLDLVPHSKGGPILAKSPSGDREVSIWWSYDQEVWSDPRATDLKEPVKNNILLGGLRLTSEGMSLDELFAISHQPAPQKSAAPKAVPKKSPSPTTTSKTGKVSKTSS